jgi:two-component system, response regulator YesN
LYKILVADDERTIREGIVKTLQDDFKDTATILAAANGKEAFELFCKSEIDVIITDIVMPEMGGLELLNRCQAQKKICAFLILTSYDDFHYAQEAIRTGVCEYILKPCSPEELIRVTKQAVLHISRQKKVDIFLPRIRIQMLHDFFHGLTADPQFISPFLKTVEGVFRFYVFCNIGDIPVQKNLFEDSVLYIESGNLYLFIKQSTMFTSSDICSQMEKYENSLGIPFTALPVIVSSPDVLKNASALFTQVSDIIPLRWYFKDRDIIDAGTVHTATYQKNQIIEQDILKLLSQLQKTDEEYHDTVSHLFKICASGFYDFHSVQDLCLRTVVLLTESRNQELEKSVRDADCVDKLYYILQSVFDREVICQDGIRYQHYSIPVKRVIDYTRTHINDTDISLHKVSSDAVFFNSDYLGKLFKKETGLKFSDWLVMLRMQNAKTLLLKTDYPISQIAIETGFAGKYPYFCKLFRKISGETPGEYRKNRSAGTPVRNRIEPIR